MDEKSTETIEHLRSLCARAAAIMRDIGGWDVRGEPLCKAFDECEGEDSFDLLLNQLNLASAGEGEKQEPNTLKSGGSGFAATIHVTRKDTGLVETYQLVEVPEQPELNPPNQGE